MPKLYSQMVSQNFFKWAVKNIINIDFAYLTQENYIKSKWFLKNYFDQAMTIKET